MIDLPNLPLIVEDAFYKCDSVLQKHQHPILSISGGSDSDIMLDMVCRLGYADKCTFVFFDTGIEYSATKEHLKYLEDRYSVQIERIRPQKPVPVAVHQEGIPFLTKYVSEMIGRLQKHGFQWEAESFEILLEKYPNCKSALKWWCNAYEVQDGYTVSMFRIAKFPYLKEFLMKFPPEFPISDKCCKHAKKDLSKQYLQEHPEIDLRLMGIRKTEGGIRVANYKQCYYAQSESPFYMPLFWFTDADKVVYEQVFDIVHSDCYTVYGMKRTGCAGCPFNSKFQRDLENLQQYEPQLYKASNKIFGKSYEYTLKYKAFKKEMQYKAKNCGQMSFFDIE